MTLLDLLAQLADLGIALSVQDGKPTLKKPTGFTGEGRLALLMPDLRTHRAAILASMQAVEPWACSECDRMFYASRQEVRALYAGRSPHHCGNKNCPQMRG